MNYPDLINGLFEAVGGMMIMLSIRALHRDKIVRGFSPAPTAFFASWGLWNLIYYPGLGQWFSFAGGLLIVSMNIAWLCQIAYYWRPR